MKTLILSVILAPIAWVLWVPLIYLGAGFALADPASRLPKRVIL